uniref:Cupin 2 conserved barrel domain-containing protein n=1 Tax=viral metagenome TaxID=1070528 RepID=A0A6C0B8C2_9ZZZZ
MQEEEYIRAYEYEKNVNPSLNHVPFYELDIENCSYGIEIIDFSSIFNVSYKSTTPNLLASFIKLDENKTIELNNDEYNANYNGTSHIFYIINGHCKINIDESSNELSSGDILVCPLFDFIKLTNLSEN